jgi:hypothetical protein
MSRIKNISRLAWFIIGVIVAVLLVPSVAVAAGLKFTGIEGTNGTSTALNQANVASSGQLSTSSAPLSKLFTADGAAGLNIGAYVDTIVAPSGHDDVITSVVMSDETTQDNAFILVDDSSNCTSSTFSIVLIDDDTTQETPSYTFPSGVAVPNGDSLCITQGSEDDEAAAFVSGYQVPAGTLTVTFENSTNASQNNSVANPFVVKH